MGKRSIGVPPGGPELAKTQLTSSAILKNGSSSDVSLYPYAMRMMMSVENLIDFEH
jgi:hypothetical protein